MRDPLVKRPTDGVASCPFRSQAGLAWLLVALASSGCAGSETPPGEGGSASATAGAGGTGGSDPAGGAGGDNASATASSTSTGSGPEDCTAMFPNVEACHEPHWDEAEGACTVIPSADGSPCFDGDDCSTGDACLAGVCESGSGTPSATACQTGIGSITAMPGGTTTLSFDACIGGCACCGAGQTYQDPIDNACVTCALDASLAEHGITRIGGLGTYFVDCITGNPDAPIAHTALFANGTTVELDFTEGVTFAGFTALPTASSSLPTVTLEGYSSDGVLVGTDSFDFLTPGGDCTTSNPAARFFGFRACCGQITRVVATFSDPNTAIDSISFF